MNAKYEILELARIISKTNISLETEDFMDSLDMVEFIIKAEEIFKINILDDEAQKVRTPGDLLKLVYEKRPELKRSSKIKRILNKK